jgi:hypothetical protein
MPDAVTCDPGNMARAPSNRCDVAPFGVASHRDMLNAICSAGGQRHKSAGRHPSFHACTLTAVRKKVFRRKRAGGLSTDERFNGSSMLPSDCKEKQDCGETQDATPPPTSFLLLGLLSSADGVLLGDTPVLFFIDPTPAVAGGVVERFPCNGRLFLMCLFRV